MIMLLPSSSGKTTIWIVHIEKIREGRSEVSGDLFENTKVKLRHVRNVTVFVTEFTKYIVIFPSDHDVILNLTKLCSASHTHSVRRWANLSIS